MTPQERKVMEQALEALKDLQLCTDDYYESSHEASKKGDKAITAIKEALAQQSNEQVEPVALVIDGVLVKSALPEKYTGHLYTAPPQPKEPKPEQEPVAIADGTFNHNCPIGTPLYTTPPQRKPLTDEQIKGIYEDCDAPTGGQFTLAFARAIEAAHGIKE